MSVKSVSSGLFPSYGSLASSSQSAKVAARPQDFTPSPVPGAGDAVEAVPAIQGSDHQSHLEQALRQSRVTAGTPATDDASDSLDGQSSPGITLYQRVSQYGSNESSSSALLQRWNSVVQSGGNAEDAAADFVRSLAQNNGAQGLRSSVIDLTA